MINNGKLSETLKIDFETMVASTTGGTTSAPYDMSGFDRAFIGVSIGLRPASIATLSTVWVDLMETSAVTAAMTSACGAKTGIVIGSLGNTAIAANVGCKTIFLKMGTGTTTGETFHLGLGTDIVTFTFSSLATMIAVGATNTNIKATVAYFGSGSAIDSSANTGETLCLDNIRAILESTQCVIGGPNVFKITTPSTNSMTLGIANSTKGCWFFSNTASTETILGHAGEIACGFDIRSDQLTSTLNKRFIGVKMTSCAQAGGITVSVIRAQGRYMPSGFVGKLSS
jgi:hypothetical protein